MSAEAPGIETIFYALKKIIEEKGYDENGRPQEFYLKTIPFAKKMKGLSVHDKHNLLVQREIKNYGNQLLKVALFWNKDKRYRDELWDDGTMWQVQEVGSSTFAKLKIVPKEVTQ